MATDVQRSAKAPAPAKAADEASAPRLRSLQLSENERRAEPRSWGRRLLWLGVLVVALGGATAAAMKYSGAGMPDMTEVDVITFGDQKGDDIVLDLMGHVAPAHKVSVPCRASGPVINLPIEEGQHVKAGDLLAEIDPTTYRSEVEQARAGLKMAQIQLEELQHGSLPEEVESAKAAVDQAKSALELVVSEKKRKIEVNRKHDAAVTDAEMEQMNAKETDAVATLRNALAQLAMIENGPRKERIAHAQAELERNETLLKRAQFSLDSTKVTAPIEGVVLERKLEAGEAIPPDMALCVIADLTNMEALVNVQEQDLKLLKLGQPCEVIPDAYSDRVYKAQYVKHAPKVNIALGVVEATIKILEPDDRLLADMNCRVVFKRDPAELKNQANQTPTIPKGAVVTEEGKSFVYVVENLVAHKRPVEVGAVSGSSDQVEVKSGLNKGDIVLSSAAEIKDGQLVRPRIPAAG